MDEKIQKKLHDLFMLYRKSLPEKIRNIEIQWQEQLQHRDVEQFKNFHREVHSLCGSAGTYGYPELSKAARQLEIFLKSKLGIDTLSSEDQVKITAYITQIKAVLSLESPKNLPDLRAVPTDNPENKFIYIVEQDEELVKELKESLTHVGYSTHYIQDIITLQRAVQEKQPVAIIMNAFYLDQIGVQLILDIQKEQQIPIQLFCILPNADLMPRLQAVRAGCDAFFSQPVDISYLTQVLNQKCGLIREEPYRILIIDDSKLLTEYYALILNQAGMNTRAITNPLELLQELEAFQPDLLLMDIYMPECTGLELAGVLRLESNYTKIPIIFLSTEEDKNKKLLAISLGGDDFLTKPILPQHLISAVRSRSKRASILNYYMTTDSLTGLLNHSSILKQLDIEVLRARQKKIPLSFVMIDIDHFKKINDTYGHLLGDVVLKKLSTLFLVRLRGKDTVGRYGGEEFALILPGSSIEDCKKICDELRIQFSQYNFTAEKADFFVTFSAGISALNLENTASNIIINADQALYQAKHLGRNQVVAFNYS